MGMGSRSRAKASKVQTFLLVLLLFTPRTLACADQLENCAILNLLYDCSNPDYVDFLRANCGAHCGFCTPTTPTNPTPTPEPTQAPSLSPTKRPTTLNPSHSPTLRPSIPGCDDSGAFACATFKANGYCTSPTWFKLMYENCKYTCAFPQCTGAPTTAPSVQPSLRPTASPTEQPSAMPTNSPSSPSPTEAPTSAPTPPPSPNPTFRPSADPVISPVSEPTPAPSPNPTTKPVSEPTPVPSPNPTTKPVSEPTPSPSPNPTNQPTPNPVISPVTQPTSPKPNPASSPVSQPTPPNTSPAEPATPNPTLSAVTPRPPASPAPTDAAVVPIAQAALTFTRDGNDQTLLFILIAVGAVCFCAILIFLFFLFLRLRDAMEREKVAKVFLDQAAVESALDDKLTTFDDKLDYDDIMAWGGVLPAPEESEPCPVVMDVTRNPLNDWGASYITRLSPKKKRRMQRARESSSEERADTSEDQPRHQGLELAELTRRARSDSKVLSVTYTDQKPESPHWDQKPDSSMGLHERSYGESEKSPSSKREDTPVANPSPSVKRVRLMAPPNNNPFESMKHSDSSEHLDLPPSPVKKKAFSLGTGKMIFEVERKKFEDYIEKHGEKLDELDFEEISASEPKGGSLLSPLKTNRRVMSNLWNLDSEWAPTSQDLTTRYGEATLTSTRPKTVQARSYAPTSTIATSRKTGTGSTTRPARHMPQMLGSLGDLPEENNPQGPEMREAVASPKHHTTFCLSDCEEDEPTATSSKRPKKWGRGLLQPWAVLKAWSEASTTRGGLLERSKSEPVSGRKPTLSESAEVTRYARQKDKSNVV